VFTVAIVAVLVTSLKEVLVAATLPLIGLNNKDPLVVFAVDTERIKAFADEVALTVSITELAVKRDILEDVLRIIVSMMLKTRKINIFIFLMQVFSKDILNLKKNQVIALGL
jgi:hypothetical protein